MQIKVLLALLLFTSSALAGGTRNPLAYCWRFLTPTTPLSRDARTLGHALSQKGEAKKRLLLEYAAPRPKTNFDRSFAVADWLMAAWITYGIGAGFYDDPWKILVALAALPPSLFLADLIGQGFHAWLDKYASEMSRIWGRAAQEFRKHHEAPSNLNHLDYLSNVSAFGKLMAPFFVGASLVEMDPVAGTSTLVVLLALLNTTEFHRQAHLPRANGLFRFLQKYRLAISRDHHMKHHNPPFNSEFAVFNAWSEGLTRKLKLWDRLDRLWWRATKRLPGNWVQDPRAIPQDVLDAFYKDVNTIPEEVFIYSEVYPNRISPEVATLLAFARRALRDQHIQNELASRRAQPWPSWVREAIWLGEQLERPWEFGEELIPLGEQTPQTAP